MNAVAVRRFTIMAIALIAIFGFAALTADAAAEEATETPVVPTLIAPSDVDDVATACLFYEQAVAAAETAAETATATAETAATATAAHDRVTAALQALVIPSALAANYHAVLDIQRAIQDRAQATYAATLAATRAETAAARQLAIAEENAVAALSLAASFTDECGGETITLPTTVPTPTTDDNSGS
ncbi:hypothetical protein COU18_02730 [Candidatus Kaiserbacteria bacterium CG10_big_fil_rev_8_21_14_0_10_51_14]|uniref:DUF5667 domain-containing protein n=1 Tax=Candidatus Kaiserbacteria bacterium CG10_big_fil_rev_8_21_14_0_10_51_14 TaxID=1974610 RepID=A0A2H0UCS8_9BACT|nr:MAG: hypothetical protein COU18_02730 [Candidatus Kaiserbacteria bacterium CG10_big_fil_rev_8_21_14_0_10_51_14]